MRRISIRTASAAALFLACVTAYSACNLVDLAGPEAEVMTLSLQGQVTSALDGWPMEGVQVVIAEGLESDLGAWRPGGNAEYLVGVLTDRSGHYSLSHVPRRRWLVTPYCSGDPRPSTARVTNTFETVWVLAVSVDDRRIAWEQVGQPFVPRCTEDVQTANFQLCPLSAWNPDSRACVPPATSR